MFLQETPEALDRSSSSHIIPCVEPKPDFFDKKTAGQRSITNNRKIKKFNMVYEQNLNSFVSEEDKDGEEEVEGEEETEETSDEGNEF